MSAHRCLLVSLALATSVVAQNSRIFGWKFGGNFFSNSLSTCEKRPIIIQPFGPDSPADALGVPPYFMLALATGSTPRLYPLGSNTSKLEWTVDYPASTELMLTVIDSNNTSGGVPFDLFSVVAGQDVGCVKPVNTNSDFTISADVSNTINTCEPWGITVKGGVPPYHWTLAQLGSPVVTNVTGSAGEDELVYIMRGDVGQKLFVTASDATGQYAYGTPFITPQGSTNVDCPGLNSRTGNSTELAKQKLAAEKASAEASQRTRIIIGVVVPIVVLVLLGLVAAFWYIRRRKRQQQGPQPLPFATGVNDDVTVQPDLRVDPYHPLPSASTNGQTPSPYGSEPSALTSRPSFTTFPASAAARRKRLMDAQSIPTTPSTVALLSTPSQHAAGTSMRQVQDGEEIIIQHQDGGGVVRELPPPYMDRGNASSSAPSSTDETDASSQVPIKRG